MTISLAGAIGAAVGLYVGWLDWKNRQAGGDGGVAARHKALLGALVFGVPVFGFPIIGYWAASQLAG